MASHTTYNYTLPIIMDNHFNTLLPFNQRPTYLTSLTRPYLNPTDMLYNPWYQWPQVRRHLGYSASLVLDQLIPTDPLPICPTALGIIGFILASMVVFPHYLRKPYRYGWEAMVRLGKINNVGR